MPDAELADVLPRHVRAAGLPDEEPISRWLAEPDAQSLKLRAFDHALVIDGAEYHVNASTGIVEVKDVHPRSMRYQRYDPQRPGQPYMHPSRELDTLPARE